MKISTNNATTPTQLNIPDLLSKLTVEEKASLLSGDGWWNTRAIPRLNIPSIRLADGPHGIRRQTERNDSLGVGKGDKAVCFPAESLLACSFDRDLVKTTGSHIAKEAIDTEVSVVLGAGINIKRSPLCGRNFEYYSEDALLSGELGAAFVNGLESTGVSSCIKHYACNNQENCRFVSDSRVDIDTLHNTYLRAFRTVVKKASPQSIMTSYNLINGEYVSESTYLLEETLRQDWGFKGATISDWGGVCDRAAALKAGLDLEMPDSHGHGTATILSALKNKSITLKDLDRAVENVLNLINRALAPKTIPQYTVEDSIAFTARAASESMVLLKNEGLLPLDKSKKIALIGELFAKPRYQGGGSSHINAHNPTSFISALDAAGIPYEYEKGYDLATFATDNNLIDRAVALAKAHDTVLIAAGLTEADESEGYDRLTLELAPYINEVVQAVLGANKNCGVLIYGGSAMTLPWQAHAKAILYCGLGGEGAGFASRDIVFGDVNPSGRLAETFPLRLEDTPTFTSYGAKHAYYGEGEFVGYKWYHAKKIPVLYPFGHGLSYTDFRYSNFKLINQDDNITVTLDVTNTGSIAGKHSVLLFSSHLDAVCPQIELTAFTKVELAAGATISVTFDLTQSDLSRYHEGQYFTAGGRYIFGVGNAAHLTHIAEALLVGNAPKPRFNHNSTLRELTASPVGQEIVKSIFSDPRLKPQTASNSLNTMLERMFFDLPLRALLVFAPGKFTPQVLEMILHQLNS